MRVLVINPIVYTAETKNIVRAKSIKDTMIYDLCLAFHEQGHEVTLFAAEPYQPCCAESYPFEVRWEKCILPKIFLPHRFPTMPEVKQYIRKNRDEIDLIITSEIFSMNSLWAYRTAPNKTIVWHELAKHNAMMKYIPSKIWYGIVAKAFMKDAYVIARSKAAQEFIGKYCRNVSQQYIDHGVNLDKFPVSGAKENCFLVCSQLIQRKRVDGIIRKFQAYLQRYDSEAKLYIAGDGDETCALKELVRQLGMESSVVFCGKLTHDELRTIMPKAKAMLINTVKDNSMISIVESIACGTPIVTTDVPLNSAYIRQHQLGIAKKEWDENDLHEVCSNNDFYAENCVQYREKLSTHYRVEQFIENFTSRNE